jgi:serine protease AprX
LLQIGAQAASAPGSSGTVATRSALAQAKLVDDHGRPLDGRGTSIAVIDTGIDPSHPAFRLGTATKVVRNLSVVPCEVTQNLTSGINCVVDVGSLDTDLVQGGHGTFIGGVAVGDQYRLPDGSQVGGQAPGARLVVLSATITLQGIQAAFHWVLQHHAKPCGAAVPATVCPPIRVVNLSWGEGDPTMAPLEDALVHAGLVVLWANGNGGGDGSVNNSNPVPTADPTPGILTVASYDDLGTGSRDGHVSIDSARGDAKKPTTWPDISAPGVNILSACRPTSAVCQADGSHPRNGPGPHDNATYWVSSGTLWATAALSGVVALLFQADPDASPALIDRVLKATAHRYRAGAPYHLVDGLPSSFDKGAGLVDAYAAALVLGAHRPR